MTPGKAYEKPKLSFLDHEKDMREFFFTFELVFSLSNLAMKMGLIGFLCFY